MHVSRGIYIEITYKPFFRQRKLLQKGPLGSSYQLCLQIFPLLSVRRHHPLERNTLQKKSNLILLREQKSLSKIKNCLLFGKTTATRIIPKSGKYQWHCICIQYMYTEILYVQISVYRNSIYIYSICIHRYMYTEILCLS